VAITKTDITTILRGKRQSDPYKLADSGGLYLYVTATALLWRYDYRINCPDQPDHGKRKTRSYGEYGEQAPGLDLNNARRLHQADRISVAAGGDPAADAKEAKHGQHATTRAVRQSSRHLSAKAINGEPAVGFAFGTFGYAANGWDALQEKQAVVGKRSPKTRARDSRMVRCCNNSFGHTALADVAVPNLSKLLDVFEGADKYTTRQRLQSTAVNVMGFAQGKGWIKYNPFVGVAFGKAYTAPTDEPRPAITEVEPFGQLLRDVAGYQGRQGNIVGRALNLLSLTFLRPGNIVAAEWSEFDLDDKQLWTIPFKKLKQRSFREGIKELKGKPHFVPLSKQAVKLLRELETLTGDGRYLFPNAETESGHITTEGLESAVNLLGYQGVHCPHGFRSSASTLLNAERITVEGTELPRFAERVVEFQLEHVEKSVAAIYNRDQRLPERVKLMQHLGRYVRRHARSQGKENEIENCSVKKTARPSIAGQFFLKAFCRVSC
jgi:integrase